MTKPFVHKPDEADIGDTWRLIRNESMERRASHRENGQKILKSRGYTFYTHNDGAHLVVCTNKGSVDLWPGTGKWCIRDGQVWGRGIFRLLSQVKPA